MTTNQEWGIEMLKFFKRRRPTPAPAPVRISLEDEIVARWWGYTPEQWLTLPALVKVDKREGFFSNRGLA